MKSVYFKINAVANQVDLNIKYVDISGEEWYNVGKILDSVLQSIYFNVSRQITPNIYE